MVAEGFAGVGKPERFPDISFYCTPLSDSEICPTHDSRSHTLFCSETPSHSEKQVQNVLLLDLLYGKPLCLEFIEGNAQYVQVQ